MSDESDFDDDIDKLLDEIDSVSTQKKPVAAAFTTKPGLFSADQTDKSGPASTEDASGDKVTLKSDGNGFKVNYGTGSGGFKLSDLKKSGAGGDSTKDPAKSVYFTENPVSGVTAATSAPNSQPPPNSFLSNLLGSSEKVSTAPAAAAGGKDSPTPTANSKASKADWLGLSAKTGGDIPKTPPMARRFQQRQQPSTTGAADESTVNFGDDDDDELLRAMGLDSGRKSKPAPADVAAERKPNPAPPPSKPKSGFELDDDFWPKPGSFKPQQPPAPTRSETIDKPESTLRNTLLQRAAMTRDRDRPESPFETPAPRFQPPVTSTPSQPVKSIVDVLPFLSKSKPVEEPPPESFEPMYVPDRAPSTAPMRSMSPAVQNMPSQQPAPARKTKKVQHQQQIFQQQQQAPPPISMYADPNRSTLQLPSHLVDEDELKTMCNSLKSLYTNQLDMQEKSYQDQMECLVQSHSRKEELLREEIKVLHKEYDARLVRLKNELLESETKLPQRLQAELSTMANFSQQLQSHQQQLLVSRQQAFENESPRSVQPNPSSNFVPPPELDKILEEKLSSFMDSIKSLPTSTKNSKELHDVSVKLDSIQKRFDAFAKYRMDEETQKNMQLYEAEKKLQEEIAKLNKQQKKIKESVVKAAIMSITQAMEYHQEGTNHKKDKISGQLKEFRKDVRRILFDLEAKNDVVQKSHIHMESDQKEMLQVLRELQTMVKVNSMQAKLSSEFHSSGALPYPVAHTQQVQQAEMEIKLLREERNSLSDSIAQMNVERRKLNEEKLNIEREKMDLEREKNRMRDMEMQMKIKMAEAEDMKKHAEDIRKTESSKAIEMTIKAAEVEKERTILKDQYHLSENRLRMREQKLIQEKTELMREKEFLEKLRDQLLCPGCMKSVHHIGMSSRSEGDGLDISFSAAGDISSKLQTLSAALPQNDQNYLQRESLFLDDLYFKQFNPK